jgi:hypothetical protein
MLILALPAAFLAACGARSLSLSEQHLLDMAWDALEPHTSSHSQDNWEVVAVRQVNGQEVVALFQQEQPRCVWPTPLPNERIRPSGEYWYVEMKPRPATPLPGEKLSPTAPPRIPEPFVRQAFFLLDAVEGRVVARMLYCVIY